MVECMEDYEPYIQDDLMEAWGKIEDLKDLLTHKHVELKKVRYIIRLFELCKAIVFKSYFIKKKHFLDFRAKKSLNYRKSTNIEG